LKDACKLHLRGNEATIERGDSLNEQDESDDPAGSAQRVGRRRESFVSHVEFANDHRGRKDDDASRQRRGESREPQLANQAGPRQNSEKPPGRDCAAGFRNSDAENEKAGEDDEIAREQQRGRCRVVRYKDRHDADREKQ
jgi:hypothetical protein